MTKDNKTEDTDLSQENGSDDTTENENEGSQDQDNGQQDDQGSEGDQVDSQQDESSDEGYRGKLNATNRFLQKEGYVFEKGKGWHKPKGNLQQQQRSQEQEQAAPGLTREEAIFLAKGFSEEELDQAKKVAALERCKLTEVPDNDLFKSWKARRDKEKKDKDAQLGASRGARTNVKKTLASTDLTEEEHKALFNEKISR